MNGSGFGVVNLRVYALLPYFVEVCIGRSSLCLPSTKTSSIVCPSQRAFPYLWICEAHDPAPTVNRLTLGCSGRPRGAFSSRTRLLSDRTTRLCTSAIREGLIHARTFNQSEECAAMFGEETRTTSIEIIPSNSISGHVTRILHPAGSGRMS